MLLVKAPSGAMSGCVEPETPVECPVVLGVGMKRNPMTRGSHHIARVLFRVKKEKGGRPGGTRAGTQGGGLFLRVD